MAILRENPTGDRRSFGSQAARLLEERIPPPLPQHLIMRLVEITGHNPWFILTGEPCPFLNSTRFWDLRVVEERSGSKYHPHLVAESARGRKA